MKGIGIDAGSGSISIAVTDGNQLLYQDYRLHKGNIYGCLKEMIENVKKKFPEGISFGAVGSSGEWLYPGFYGHGKNDRISALLAGRKLLCPQAETIFEMGAHTSCCLTGLTEGKNFQYAMNGECAAGTGSFFEDQMYRLGLPLCEYSECVKKAVSVPRLAGRCSVFAKTDLIHRQQEGIPKEDILLGLAYAVVRNFRGTIVRKLKVEKPVVLTGGVVLNEGVKTAVKNIFDLKDEELLCDEKGTVFSAAGLAKLALEQKMILDWSRPVEEQKKEKVENKGLPAFTYDKKALHKLCPVKAGEKTWLGVDIGSTSTNLVWLGEDKQVIDLQYLRTKGDPKGVIEEGLSFWKEKYGLAFAYAGMGITGSGRYLIGKKLSADTIIDEITAQAKAAVYFFPDADTVFEIGGQDSKFISLKNGQVVDFEMNKVCAAGTGSFIEEQAERLGISVERIGTEALKSEDPSKLGERCTVLMESKIAAQMEKGASYKDICAGLCVSVVNNYLDRVAAGKKYGDVICLQGGIVHNEGIVAAFYQRFGKRLRITPYYDVTGAFGAALAAMESLTEKESDDQIQINTELYDRNREWFLAGYDGKMEPGLPVVGIPQCMMLYKFFPMAYQYFKNLGFNVLLSRQSDEEMVHLSQELVQEETCYPVKLLHGHMESLARQKVDYMFIPCIRTLRHATSGVKHNYGCVYMQLAPVFIAKTLGLEKRGIKLLAPVLDLDMGQPQLGKAMLQMGMSLGREKELCKAALEKGAAAMKLCEKKSEELGQKIMDSLKPDDKVLVLITRNYGLSDPILNMGIPKELLKRGCKVLNLAHLQGHSLDLSGEYPNLYWPFAQHILSGAKIIKNHPNLYAVYLTNHGCGPDAMIAHLFKEIMGDKPYLSIEVDEHQSAVGVVTRIEAFLNSLKHVKKTYFLPPLSVYSRLAALYLESKGLSVQLLSDYTKGDLDAGKAENMAKEYCTFSAQAGQWLRLKKTQGTVCVIPQTEGAEAEGLGAEVIRRMLAKHGWNGKIYAPFLEDLTAVKDKEQIWQLLLLGDGWYGLSPKERKAASKKSLADIKFPLKWENTRKILEEWSQVQAMQPFYGRKILLCGSPILMYSDYLNRNLEAAIEERNFRPVYASFAEYIWFWLKEAGREVPDFFTETLTEFAGLFPDSCICGSYEEQYAALQKHFMQVTGGNLRYLAWRCENPGSRINGIIRLLPAYANYGSIIRLIEENSPVPLLHYQLDGNEEQDEIEKRDIFLNLLEQSL